ncbi:MAG: Crp/Fnr family transcriptional regulator [Robiginitomaculum sp.]|nr:Crp/Fnr family transcriptional regulator [Robiginitomaculum sp.]
MHKTADETENKSNFSGAEGKLIKSLGLNEGSFSLRIGHIVAKRGDVLFCPGDESKAFLILLQGCIRVDLTTKSDREIVLYRVKEAETCLITTTALLQSEVYFARGVAETDIKALALSASDFHTALAVSPVFAQHVLSDYARRVESLVGLIDRLTSKDVKADIAAALLAEMDEDGVVTITQTALARNIGTAREVVSRKLSELETHGIVKRERGRIRVLDKTKLM